MKNTQWIILIVDDDPNDRFLLERTLKGLRDIITVRTAVDGVDAIDYLDGKGKFKDRKCFPFPTFIFVDLKMPRLDGFGVLQHLKKNPQWAIVPTVVFSASQDLDDVKKAFLCGASAYHVKPDSIEELRTLCARLLDYWDTTEVPQTNDHGQQLKTASAGKLGERIEQP
jgi:CheY-like chemotaxis protein